MLERRPDLYALQPEPRRWWRQYSIRSLLVLQLLLAVLLWLAPSLRRAWAEFPETTLADNLPLLTFVFFAALFVGVVAITSGMRRQGAAFLIFSILLVLAMFWTLIGFATAPPVLPDDQAAREVMQTQPGYVASLAFRCFIPGMWSLVIAAGIGVSLRMENA